MSGRLMIRPSQKRAGRFFVTTPCRGSRCTAISPAPQNGLIEIQCLLGCVALGFLVGGLLGAVEFKNCNRFDLWQHLDAFQLTVHSSTATTDLHVDYVVSLAAFCLPCRECRQISRTRFLPPPAPSRLHSNDAELRATGNQP